MLNSVQASATTPLASAKPEIHRDSPLHRIGIVGGGLVGTSLAIMTARAHMRDQTNSKIHIRIFDLAPPGPGLPYSSYSKHSALSDVYLLNQPNNRMGFDPDEPLAFCEHINKHNPEAVVRDFSSRQAYGTFVQESLKTTTAELKAFDGSQIEWVKARVLDIEEKANTCTLITDDCQYIENVAILATGHDTSNYMTEIKHHSDFMQMPVDLDQLQQRLSFNQQQSLKSESQTDHLLIIGTSQSQMDAIAALKALNYQGMIHSISRRNILPWDFQPEHHPLDFDFDHFQLKHFTAQQIEHFIIQNQMNDDQLHQLFQQEIDSATSASIGKGFVFAKIIETFKNHPNSSLQKFVAFAAAKFGNPTPPSRYALYEKLQDAGQLHIHQGDLRFDDLKAHEAGGFTLKNQTSLDNLRFSMVFNGASFARKPVDLEGQFYSALLRTLAQKGYLKPYIETGYQAGKQTPHIYMANGPCTNLTKWGIETFRDQNHAIANQIIEQFNGTKINFSDWRKPADTIT